MGARLRRQDCARFARYCMRYELSLTKCDNLRRHDYPVYRRLRRRGLYDERAVAMTPVVPENSIRPGWMDEAESGHHPMRCLRSSTCLERMSPICSSRGAG